MAGAKIATDLFELELKVAPDKLKAFAAFSPKGQPVKRADIIAALAGKLAEAQLELGVIDDISRRLTIGQKVSERLIAKGVPPIEGSTGRLVALVKPFTGKPEVSGDEKSDLRSALHLFDNVVSGQPLARIFPPTTGTPGINVLGEPIPATIQKPVKYSHDKTIAVEQRKGEHSGEYLVALIDGYVARDGERFSIQPELKLPYDVDLHTGNIDFVASLHIQGSVEPGFSVRAKKVVNIKGDARQAVVECSEGDITIGGFVFGGGNPARGRITAKGNVTIRNAQEIIVDAGGDITLQQHAVDCVLRSYRSVSASKARIIGGETLVVCGVDALELGNDAGKVTKITLCNTAEATPEFAELESQRSRVAHAVRLIELNLGPYVTNPARIALLNRPFRDRMESLAEKRNQLLVAQKDLEKRREALLRGATLTGEPRVNIRGMLFPGAEIRCQGEIFVPKDPIAGPVSIDYKPETKSFSVGVLTELTCSLDAPPTNATTTDQKQTSKGKKI